MDEPPKVNPLLTAAPRHLRRRRPRKEIPDTLLVPGAEPVAAPPPKTGGQTSSSSVKPRSHDAAKSYRRKRLVALGLVILVVVSVLSLMLALVLNG